MNGRKSFLSLAVCAVFLFGLVASHEAEAKKQRVVKDPDAPTNREAKILGWGPVKTPNRAKNPEFLVRGVVTEVQELEEPKGLKDHYQITILPIEVLNNHQRYVTFDQFQNGLEISLRIPKSKLKELKIGRLVEYNQYYTTEVEQSIGGAKMIGFTFHQDIQGYPASAAAYLRKPGFYPIQYKNALKGMQIYTENVQSDEDIKANLDLLASKSSEDPELQTIAKNTYLELYQTEPTGHCSLDKTTEKFVCKN